MFDNPLLNPQALAALQQRQMVWNPLAQASANMLAVSGPSRAPVGFGQALGAGLGGWNQASASGTTQALQAYLLNLELTKRQREEAQAQTQQRARDVLSGGGGPAGVQFDPMQAGDKRFIPTMLQAYPGAADQYMAGLMKPPLYKEREMPLADNRVQKEVSRDNGQTWEKVGEPYDRRNPFMTVQDIDMNAGTVNTRLVRPNDLMTAGASPSPAPGAAPAPSATGPGIVIGEKPQRVLNTSEAGRVTMVERAIQNIENARNVIMPNGKVDRGVIVSMNMPIIGGPAPFAPKGQSASLNIRNAIAAKVRQETGAQLNEAELNDMTVRFMPNVTDADSTVKQKLDELQTFMRGSLENIAQFIPARAMEMARARAPLKTAPAVSDADAKMKELKQRYGLE